uniref:uncharacterized protein LOC118519083 n=1 Tax=Halichoerus grypus TaxID=9711 RepID=UPI001659D03A|nr:uncharacterized protein LOC118519083 [Halichoerus grypus]
MRLQKSLLPRAAPNPRPRRRVFLAGTLRPSQASCPHAPRAPRARPQSRGPRSSRGQSRCRRALCRPLPEAPVSSRSCPLLPRPPHRCGPSRGDGSLCPSASGSADRKRGKSEQTTKSPGKAVKDAEMTTLPRSVKDRVHLETAVARGSRGGRLLPSPSPVMTGRRPSPTSCKELLGPSAAGRGKPISWLGREDSPADIWISDFPPTEP